MGKKQTLKSIVTALCKVDIGDVICIEQEEINALHVLIENLELQLPSPVTDYRVCLKSPEGCYYTFELCPNCQTPISRTYQSCCGTCGQKLKWIDRKKMKRV